jgi:hypothetical protein
MLLLPEVPTKSRRKLCGQDLPPRNRYSLSASRLSYDPNKMDNASLDRILTRII